MMWCLIPPPIHQTVCRSWQERCSGRRSDLRGDEPAESAAEVCTGEDARSAGIADADDGAQWAGEAPHASLQCHSRSCSGVRACLAQRPLPRRGTALRRVEQSQEVPELAREMFKVLAGQSRHAEAQIREIEATLMAPASRQRGKPAAGCHSVGWTNRRHGDGCKDRRCQPLSVRDAILQLSSA